MLKVLGLNFDSKYNQINVNNNQNHSAKFQSQSVTDTVSFGASQIQIVRTLDDQARLISNFLGEQVNHEQGWAFKSVKTYSIGELDKLYDSALEKMNSLGSKIGNYTKKEQIGECIAAAYDYLLKTGNDVPIWFHEPKDICEKEKALIKLPFRTYAAPVGQSDTISDGFFSNAMTKNLHSSIKSGNNIFDCNGQKYIVRESFMSSALLDPDFIGFDIGLVK